MCDSYPRLLHTGAGKDHECCRGSPRWTKRLLLPTRVLESLTWVSSPWTRSGDDVEAGCPKRALDHRVGGCRDWRGHPLWNASQIKGPYLLSSGSHHKPWRSCRAFENVPLCPGAFPSTGPGLRNKEEPSCNATSPWEETFQTETCSAPKAGCKGSKKPRSVLSPPHVLFKYTGIKTAGSMLGLIRFDS